MPFTIAPGAGVIGLPPWPTGQYLYPTGATQTGTGSPVVGSLRLAPAVVPYPTAITRIGMEIVTAGEAGSLVRLGLYADGGAIPGALLLDAGTIPGDVAAVVDMAAAFTVPAGIVWFGAVTQNVVTTLPVWRTSTSAPVIAVGIGGALPTANATLTGASAGGVTGALPATVSGGSGGIAPRVFVKTA